MKGRLYFTTKAQKEGRIMIKTHPCAQIFCCDICGFEQVNVLHTLTIVVRMDIFVCTNCIPIVWLVLHLLMLATGDHYTLTDSH